MVATGQTVGEVEDELAEVSARLGRPDVQIAGSPTGITLDLASGEPATFESVNAPLRLDQAVEVRAISHRCWTARVGGRGDRSAARPARRPAGTRPGPPTSGWSVASAGICLILQPGAANVLFATLAGIAVAGLLRLAARFTLIATLVPALAAFIIGCGLFAAADAGLLEGPLRTALASLAVLLPGALIVTAMSELAAGDMMAGSARLIFGIVQLMLFTLGLVAASQLLQIGPEQLANIRVQGLGWWTAPAGLIIISVGITLMESPPLRLLPWIVAVLAIALTAQTLGQQVSAPARQLSRRAGREPRRVPGRGDQTVPAPAGGVPARILAARPGQSRAVVHHSTGRRPFTLDLQRGAGRRGHLGAGPRPAGRRRSGAVSPRFAPRDAESWALGPSRIARRRAVEE